MNHLIVSKDVMTYSDDDLYLYILGECRSCRSNIVIQIKKCDVRFLLMSFSLILINILRHRLMV